MKHTPNPPLFARPGWLRAFMLAALLGLTAPLAWPATDPQVSRLYEDALSRFEKKDLPGAIIQLKNALNVNNKNLAVQVLLGKALLANGEVIAAEVALSEALRLGVNRAEVVLPLAQAAVSQGKQQKLLDDPRFAVPGLPATVQAQLNLMRAGAAADMGDTRAALRLVEEARVVNPSHADSWLAEVPIRIRGRQMREAVGAAEKGLALAPTSPEAQYTRGQVAHVSGEVTVALGWYDKALAGQPNHVEALVSRAGLMMDLNRHADAQRDIKALLATSPTEPRGSYLQALLAERQGNTSAARAAYNDVTTLLDPVPPAFLRYRPQLLMLGGLSHYSLRQFEKARPYLEIVQRQQPGSPVGKLLAQIHLQEKNVDRAISSLDSYLNAFPNDAQAVLLLASAHMEQGRYARATQLTQDALKIQDAPALRTMLGLSLVGAGKFSSAAAEFEGAVKKDPKQVQAGSALIMLYLQSGQSAKAVRAAEELLRHRPNNPGLHHLLGESRAAGSDDAGARTSFERALKLDRTFSASEIGLARLEAAKGSMEQASARLSAVLAREKNNLDAMGELAAVLERGGQLPEAQRWLEKADDLAGPNHYQPALALVDMHLRNGQREAAQRAITRAQSKAPEALAVVIAVARVHLASGDTTSARAALTRGSILSSHDPTTLVRIALLQLQAGHLPGAAHSLDKALSERPDYLPAQVVLAEVDIRRGELPKAEQRARQIVAKYPKLGVGQGLLGDVAIARGQPAVAIDHYRRALQAEPTSDSLLRLHKALAAHDPAAAGQVAEQWIKQHPRDVAVLRALADGQARAGNYPTARVRYEALLKTAPADAEALNNLANVLIAMKDPGALSAAEQALKISPTAPHIIGTAGWAAFKAGQAERALQLLRDARLRDPGNQETRFFLGAVLASAGRNSEAKVELEAALKNGKRFASAGDAEQLLSTLK